MNIGTRLLHVTAGWQQHGHAAAWLLIPMLISALSACSTWPPQMDAGLGRNAATNCESNLSAADNTRLSGIEQQLNDGKFYAALAQLDALGASTPQARLIRANALRRVDQPTQAQAIYQTLVGSCLDGEAQHGLGLIASKAGRQAEGLAYLQKARQALPTDTTVRNDLGYALLLAKQYDAAQFEFLTVLDLSPQDPKATRNLVLLSFMQGKPDQARALAHKMGLDDSTVARLQQQASAP